MSLPVETESATRQYWRVMLGKGSHLADQCLADGFIGFDGDLKTDFTGQFPDDWRKFNAVVVPQIVEADPSRTKRSAGLAAAQAWTLGKGIREGDVILSPDGTGVYRVGVVNGPYRFVADHVLPHQRPVAWEGGIARDALTTPVKNSLGSLVSVVRIPEQFFSEIEGLRSGGAPAIEVTGVDDKIEDPLAFAMEMHLEDFLVRNWASTPLGKDYSILEVDGEVVGKQLMSDTGPIDILALSKDGKTYAVIELKRGRASDSVVGQTLRYMGWVREVLADQGQDVLGIIIALEDDPKLKRALSEVQNISFYRYRIDFTLEASN